MKPFTCAYRAYPQHGTLTPSSWVQNSMAPTVPFPTSSTKRMSLYLIVIEVCGQAGFKDVSQEIMCFCDTDAKIKSQGFLLGTHTSWSWKNGVKATKPHSKCVFFNVIVHMN